MVLVRCFRSLGAGVSISTLPVLGFPVTVFSPRWRTVCLVIRVSGSRSMVPSHLVRSYRMASTKLNDVELGP